MKRYLCSLVALGLLQGVSEPVNAQGTYRFTTLDVPGSFIKNLTFANGINSSGQIVGYYFDGLRAQGFLFDNGVYTTLDVPESGWTEIYGINASGQIVGSYRDARSHGFLLDHGSYTTLDVSGGRDTYAT